MLSRSRLRGLCCVMSDTVVRPSVCLSSEGASSSVKRMGPCRVSYDRSEVRKYMRKRCQDRLRMRRAEIEARVNEKALRQQRLADLQHRQHAAAAAAAHRNQQAQVHTNATESCTVVFM